MVRRAFFLAIVAAVLAGCVTTSAPLPQTSVTAYRDTITFAGTLSANYVQDGRPTSVTVKYEWQQTPGQVDISLALPFGPTIAEINVMPKSATLTQAKHLPRVARDLETLMTESFGWALPVSGLRDWLQGYATDVNGKRFAASPGNNNLVTKDGWRLRFVTWQDDDAVVLQPKRIDASRNVGGEEIEIRIVVVSVD